MDKTAIEHWSPVIGGQFWWSGVIFALIFVPLMIFVGSKLTSKQRDIVIYGMGIYQLGNKILSQVGYLLSDNYILASNLPLHLCGLSGILAGIVVFYRKQILFEFLYFFKCFFGGFFGLFWFFASLGISGLNMFLLRYLWKNHKL